MSTWPDVPHDAANALSEDNAVVTACSDCGAVQNMPQIGSGRLDCRTCGTTLQRTAGCSLEAALAFSLATLVLLVPADLLLLVRISEAGVTVQTHLTLGVAVLWDQGWLFTAGIVALQALVFPFLRFGLLSAVLGAIHFRRVGPWTGPAFRLSHRLDLWAMPDVILLGFVTGYVLLASVLPIHIGAGGWCLVGAALTSSVARAALDRRMIWQRIGAPAPVRLDTRPISCPACDLVIPSELGGEPCPRCRLRVWNRRPHAMTHAGAMVVAGCVLVPLANLYPLSIITIAGDQRPHTLFSSIMHLLHAHHWSLASVIFMTAVAIPLGKMGLMSWLCLSVRRRSVHHLIAKTRVFRLLDELGRWSNAEIFMLAIYMPLVQFGPIAQVRLGFGTPALQAAIIVTMLASALFDLRLVWDASVSDTMATS